MFGFLLLLGEGNRQFLDGVLFEGENVLQLLHLRCKLALAVETSLSLGKLLLKGIELLDQILLGF